MLMYSLLVGAGDDTNYALAEEGLRHQQHCLHDQCLQLRWGQQLELALLRELLWKQAGEVQLDVLGLRQQGEQQRWVQQREAERLQHALSFKT